MPSRRHFILGVGAGVVGIGALGAGYVFRGKLAALRRGCSVRGLPDVAARAGKGLPAAAGKSRVVQVQHARVLTAAGRPDPRAVQAMLDLALRRAFDVEKPEDAWRALFPDPTEVVGLKVNAVAGRGGVNSSPETVRAITRGLGLAGIPKENVLVFERSHEELTAAGFVMNPDGPGVRVIATNSLFRTTQLAPQALTVAGQPVRLVQMVRLCSAIINCSVVKHHGSAGYTGALKNWYGVIDQPQRFHQGLHSASFIPEVAGLDPIRTRVRLTVIEALRSQCERGPHAAREWQHTPRALMVGSDQVALDAVGARLVEEERRRRGLPSLAETGREPSYISVAASRGLGRSDAAAIEHLLDEV
ncbi:MAG: DUF362 domain-containing protein [Deltaproteobacteria bacterium]|nr:DUF362 domain-containing protein [Deltaproteobacteria bacterium]